MIIFTLIIDFLKYRSSYGFLWREQFSGTPCHHKKIKQWKQLKKEKLKLSSALETADS